MIPIGTDIDEAPPAALRKSFTFVKEEKRKKEEEALLAFVDTFRGYQVRKKDLDISILDDRTKYDQDRNFIACPCPTNVIF